MAFGRASPLDREVIHVGGHQVLSQCACVVSARWVPCTLRPDHIWSCLSYPVSKSTVLNFFWLPTDGYHGGPVSLLSVVHPASHMQIERLTIHDLCLDIRASGCDGYVVTGAAFKQTVFFFCAGMGSAKMYGCSANSHSLPPPSSPTSPVILPLHPHSLTSSSSPLSSSPYCLPSCNHRLHHRSPPLLDVVYAYSLIILPSRLYHQI